MKVLFVTLLKIDTLSVRGIYHDLLNEFLAHGHEVYSVCPSERRDAKGTYLITEGKARMLNVRTLNIQKTSIIEKGIGTLALEYQFLAAIKRYFGDVTFDLVLYSTPPITFSRIISYVKKRDGAFTYLLLKDIFPQNAVDMKLLRPNGFLHRFFLKKERRLYAVSDHIGCLSQANIEFLRKHNPEIDLSRIEINPNTIKPLTLSSGEAARAAIRAQYGLPVDKKIFAYGGNLGMPQGLDFLLDTISAVTDPDVFFLIVGTGTEFPRLEKWFEQRKPENARLLAGLPKADFDRLLGACDVGLIFLHRDFTIPNFPSRLLSYLEMKMPVLAATDPNTDVGSTVENAGCGFWVESGDLEGMLKAISKFGNASDFSGMRENAWKLLQNQFTVDRTYRLIVSKLNPEQPLNAHVS